MHYRFTNSIRNYPSKTDDNGIIDFSDSSFNESTLYWDFIETLRARSIKNYSENLRRCGLELIEIVSQRSPLNGNRISLLRDYDDIESAYIRRKGDRRD